MRRKKIFIRPELKSRRGDLSKKWYVELSQRNPATDEMVRKRFESVDGVNINDDANVRKKTCKCKKISYIFLHNERNDL